MRNHYVLKNHLKEFRKKRGYSQAELAELVGASQNAISSIENGLYCPSAYLSAVICKVLDCKWEECFYLTWQE